MSWIKGPLPHNTYGWGGVVPTGEDSTGFFFSDFKGDCVEVIPDGRILKADEVAFYDNSLQLPSGVKGRQGGSPLTAIRTADDLRRYIIESVDEWINKPIIRRFLSQEGIDVAKAQREYWRQADDVQVNLLLSILNKG